MRRELDVRGDMEPLGATRGGDPVAFDAFYRRHREVVFAYCAQRVRDPELAADLMAEAFASALLAVHDRARVLPDTQLAWLVAIAHRKLIDSYRRGRVDEAPTPARSLTRSRYQTWRGQWLKDSPDRLACLMM